MGNYTYKEYMEGARKADAAGDAEGAKRLVKLAQSKREAKDDSGFVESSIDTAGDVLGATLAGAARGVKGALELPELISRAGYRGVQEVGQYFGANMGKDVPVLESATGELIEQGLSYIPGANEAMQYRGDTGAGEFAGKVGEFLPFALKNVAKYAVAPVISGMAAEETAKSLGFGETAQSIAEVGGMIAGPSAVTKAKQIISPYGGADPARLAAAKALEESGVSVSAGQKVGDEALKRKEAQSKNFGDFKGKQLDEFTQAILRQFGSNANRATPDVLTEIQTRLGQNMNEAISGVKLIPEVEDLKNMSSVLQKFKKLKPENVDAEVPNALLKKINRSLINTVSKKGVIDEEQFISFREQLSLQTKSKNSAIRNATIGTLNILDDLMDKQLTASGRSSDIQKLNKARSDYRNYFALENAVASSGELKALGIVTPSSIGSALRSQNKRQYVQGKRGDIGDLSKSGEIAVSFPSSSGTAENIKALMGMMKSVPSASIGGAVTSALGLGPYVGAVIGGLGPVTFNKLLMSEKGQAYLANQIVSNSKGATSKENAQRTIALLAQANQEILQE